MTLLDPPEDCPLNEDDIQSWVIIQLSGFARSKMSVRQIETAVSNVLRQDPLVIYIPVLEDFYGKQDSGYGEYIFINFIPETDYSILEGEEAFTRILKEPHTRNPQLLNSQQFDAIRNKVYQEVHLYPGDVVKIIRGNLRGNYGVIQCVTEDSVGVSVYVGQEELNSVVSLHDVRRSKRRTLLRQRDQEMSFHLNGKIPNDGHFFFGAIPSIQILKEGSKHTKVSINGKVSIMLNEEVEILFRWVEDQKVSS